MLETVPAWIFIRSQPEGPGQVDHPRAGLQRDRRQRQGHLRGGAEEDQTQPSERGRRRRVGLGPNLELPCRTADGEPLAERAAGPLVAHGQGQRQAGVARDDARELYPRVARNPDDPDRDNLRAVLACAAIGHCEYLFTMAGVVQVTTRSSPCDRSRPHRAGCRPGSPPLPARRSRPARSRAGRSDRPAAPRTAPAPS